MKISDTFLFDFINSNILLDLLYIIHNIVVMIIAHKSKTLLTLALA